MKLAGFEVGLDQPFFLIAGPCVIESMQLQLDTAGTLKEITGELGIPFIFKSSFDKANRTSVSGFRGPGLEEGLKVLAEVKKQLGVPVLSRAAMAVGISGIFMETHPNPAEALSDGPNAWPLGKMRALLETLMAIDQVTKRNGFLESQS